MTGEGRAPVDGTTGTRVSTGNTSSIQQGATAHKIPSKQSRVIRALLDGPVTTFQAEKAPIFDHCLPSTISELRKDGLDIDAKRITVAGYGGRPAHIAMYSLRMESIPKAFHLLGTAR